MRVEISVCRTCRQFGRMLNNFGECGDCTEKRETNEALDHVDACMDSLGMCLNISDPDGSLRSEPPKLPSLEFYLKSWEEIRKDYRKLSDAIKALRKDSE